VSGTGSKGCGGFAASIPASLAAAAVAVSILHWFPFLTLLFAAPLFFVRFRYGNRAFAVSLPAVVAFDLLVTATTGAATGTLGLDGLVSAALGTALLSFPLFVAALPVFVRDEHALAASALVSAGAWAAVTALTPLGGEIDAFLRAFSTETAAFFAEALKEVPDSSFILARLSADALYGIARKTVSWSVFPAPFIVYTAGWRVGRWLVERFRPLLLPRFSLTGFYAGFEAFVPLSLGMLGVISNGFVSVAWLETLSWNALLGAAFPFILQGIGIARFLVGRLAARGKRPSLWVWPIMLLVFFTNGWLVFAGILMIAGVTETFVPIRRRFVDKGVADPTPGNGGDQNKQ